MKLIDLHKKWMEAGRIPHDGLCNCIDSPYLRTLMLFHPNKKEFEDFGPDNSGMFWGCGLDNDFACGVFIRRNAYTPRRQSIVLLICAMHGEL